MEAVADGGQDRKCEVCVSGVGVSCVNNAVGVAQSTLARRASTISKGTAGGRHQAGGGQADADWPVVSTGLGLQVERQELKPRSRHCCSSRPRTSTITHRRHVAALAHQLHRQAPLVEALDDPPRQLVLGRRWLQKVGPEVRRPCHCA
jgi:hypothetical protein